MPTITSLDFFIVTPMGARRGAAKTNEQRLPADEAETKKQKRRPHRARAVEACTACGDAFVLTAPFPPLEGASHVTGIGHGDAVAMRVPGLGGIGGVEGKSGPGAYSTRAFCY
ncbi:hypothetical protein AVMA1855_23010 [Acidovorax sp. SUPP1855]|nr:hypothetical protein AVMA1855_23010 [Acidovorax sp. SUPP1855]